MTGKSPYLRCINCGMHYNEEKVKEIIEEETKVSYDPSAELFCIKCIDENKSKLVHVGEINPDKSIQIFNFRDGVNKRELKNKITGQLERGAKL